MATSCPTVTGTWQLLLPCLRASTADVCHLVAGVGLGLRLHARYLSQLGARLGEHRQVAQGAEVHGKSSVDTPSRHQTSACWLPDVGLAWKLLEADSDPQEWRVRTFLKFTRKKSRHPVTEPVVALNRVRRTSIVSSSLTNKIWSRCELNLWRNDRPKARMNLSSMWTKKIQWRVEGVTIRAHVSAAHVGCASVVVA